MWCGECYTSHPTILFHVNQKEGFETDGISEEEQECVQKAWGKKHGSLRMSIWLVVMVII
jgi:hypothetical protein